MSTRTKQQAGRTHRHNGLALTEYGELAREVVSMFTRHINRHGASRPDTRTAAYEAAGRVIEAAVTQRREHTTS